MNLFTSLADPHQNLLPQDGELYYYPELFDKALSAQYFENLQNKINWRQDKIRMFGKWINQPRLTAFYGDADKSYTYSNLEMKPEPWIAELIEIKEKIETFLNQNFSSVLLNFYRDGQDSMGWHSDNEKELGQNPEIASVSFGASRVIQFRQMHFKTNKKKIEMLAGSLLLMKGKTQQFWEHSIAKEKKVIEPRINLTFRNIVSL